MWRHLRYLGGAGVRYRTRRHAREYLHLLQNCRDAQQVSLRTILALNADSAFSRERGLDSTLTIEEFRRRVPVAGYEAFRPYIERTMRGEATALLGQANPPIMFAQTSGTTAASKSIPITRRFLDDYRRGWQVWGIRNFDDHPRLHRMNLFQAVSDHDQFRSPSGLPCGNISGLVQAMQGRVIKLLYTVPDAVTKVADPEAKYYAALRLGIADPHVGSLMTANPSTLVLMAKLAVRHAESLIRDVRDGTLSSEFPYGSADHDRLRPWIRRRDPARARVLDRLAEKAGMLRPREVWPDLQVIAVWTGGSVGAYLPQVREWYGDVPFRDHGLSASEGRMTLPLGDNTSAGPLDVGTHFFEFIPVSEIESASPTVLLADELREGEEYFILLTTASGLYRYDIRDVVRCTGFLGTTPVLEFRHKGAHISSITGEKLTESQVAEALRGASEQTGLCLPPVTLCPAWGDPPRYELLVEEDETTPAARWVQFAEVLEGQLRAGNIEYADKRKTQRLAAVGLRILGAGTWERFIRDRQTRPGGSVEQYKHPILKPDLSFAETLVREFSPQSVPAAAKRSRSSLEPR
jgi:hypothetical protein